MTEERLFILPLEEYENFEGEPQSRGKYTNWESVRRVTGTVSPPPIRRFEEHADVLLASIEAPPDVLDALEARDDVYRVTTGEDFDPDDAGTFLRELYSENPPGRWIRDNIEAHR